MNGPILAMLEFGVLLPYSLSLPKCLLPVCFQLSSHQTIPWVRGFITTPCQLHSVVCLDFKREGPGYHGPEPQPDTEHRYRFTLYALDARLALQPGLDKASLLTVIQSHIVGQGELIVTFRK